MCTNSFHIVKFNLQCHFQGQIAFLKIFDLEILYLTLKMTLNFKNSGTKMVNIARTIFSDQ